MNKTILIACTLMLGANSALAQEVELSARDGTLRMRGQLVEYTDQIYTIDTPLGRMTVDGNIVTCDGEACPVIEPLSPDFSIVGLGISTGKIMPDFLSVYADYADAQVKPTADGSYVLTNADNEELSTISLFDAYSLDNVSDLVPGQAAIALSTESQLSEEAQALNLELQADSSVINSHVIGLNAITIIAAKDNPVSTISTSDIAKVFSGEYDNWSELGGNDAPITLYAPQPDSELSTSFETQIGRVMNEEEFELSEDIFFFDDVAERVAINPNGIGFTYFSDSQPAKPLSIAGECGITTPANSFSIKAEEYPLTQRLYAHRLARTNTEQADALLSFLQSDAAQETVSSNGLVDQLEVRHSVEEQATRFIDAIIANASSAENELLKEMVSQIMRSERLSTTFRFDTGSDEMDQRAQADVVRLAERLQSPENEGSVLYLVGFTDSVGDFDLNQEVSLRRANQIRDALIATNAALTERVSIVPAGFGEIAPLACNETTQGRSINRRVEVWMENDT